MPERVARGRDLVQAQDGPRPADVAAGLRPGRLLGRCSPRPGPYAHYAPWPGNRPRCRRMRWPGGQRAAELSFQSRGITFAVNQGPDGVEKIMPFDLVPRLLRADEWHIERAWSSASGRSTCFSTTSITASASSAAPDPAGPGPGGQGLPAGVPGRGRPPERLHSSSAATWCATPAGGSLSWRTTCVPPPACRTWWKIGACSSVSGPRSSGSTRYAR